MIDYLKDTSEQKTEDMIRASMWRSIRQEWVELVEMRRKLRWWKEELNETQRVIG